MSKMDVFIDGEPDDDSEEDLEDVIARVLLVSGDRHDSSLLDTQHALAEAVLHSAWLREVKRVVAHEAQLNAQAKIIELIETHLVETINPDTMTLIEELIDENPF